MLYLVFNIIRILDVFIINEYNHLKLTNDCIMPLSVAKLIPRHSTPQFLATDCWLFPATRVVIFANVTFGFTSILYGVGHTVWLPVVMK